jgi:hypothetical protein
MLNLIVLGNYSIDIFYWMWYIFIYKEGYRLSVGGSIRKKYFRNGTVNFSLHFKSEVKLAVLCYLKSFLAKLITANSTRVYWSKSLKVMYCISLTPIHMRVIEPPGHNPESKYIPLLKIMQGGSWRASSTFLSIFLTYIYQ